MSRAAAVLALACFTAISAPPSARAAGQPATLALRAGGRTRTFTAAELLARPDVATLTIPNDSSYKRAMTYRAIPVTRLLAGMPYETFDALQAVAHDGFVAEIPMRLLTSEHGATAWIAIDDPEHPWPNLPGKDHGAGPFYLVWEHPERSRIMSEQWVTEVDRLAGVESPAKRWPQLAAGAGASEEVRHGMATFVTQCLPCHRFDGAGSSTIGPDLGRPMNATAYMTERGLRALVRDPKSVRSWPNMQMPGFSAAALPDADLDAIVRYLQFKTKT